MGAEVRAHQTRTDLSRLPEAIMLLSQLREMSVTSAEWPLSVARSWPVLLLHTFSRSSSAPWGGGGGGGVRMARRHIW